MEKCYSIDLLDTVVVTMTRRLSYTITIGAHTLFVGDFRNKSNGYSAPPVRDSNLVFDYVSTTSSCPDAPSPAALPPH